MTNNNLLWQPTESDKTGSRMYAFLNHIAEKFNLPDNDFYTIHQWSVENIADFWEEIWDFCGIKSSVKYEQSLTTT